MNRRSIVIHAPIVGAAAAVPTNVMHAVKNTVAVDHSLLAKMGKNWLLPYNIVKICKWKRRFRGYQQHLKHQGRIGVALV